ncbi:heparanase-like protein 1 [Tripterygium wilfordii]|uniref:heparanase-like protein 1 n=1 Tax=Tripterygium wilfordii TaxID=458696 RepID=UPI0018F81359|nr:heparanase-like protein 1 [Tripterygium wilfordii]
MGFQHQLFLFLSFFPAILAGKVTITVDTSKTIAETDDNFICATIDWWPHDKCNYKHCPWGSSSILNLNLSHPSLKKAIEAFRSLRIRLGGSLEDQVVYGVGNLESPCDPLKAEKNGLLGFSKGCLPMKRWDELNNFLAKTGVIVTFGLNALYGRRHIKGKVWEGAWDSTNAHDFIKYTVSKGYKIDSWEFGNEICGRASYGANIDAELYGNDLIKLKKIIEDLYENSDSTPSLLAPGGFFDQVWFAKLLQVSGLGIVDSVTHHIYNLGPAGNPNLVEKILNRRLLNKLARTLTVVDQTIKDNGSWASAWIGESGGASTNGGYDVSDTFVNSFWYLDQLGMASKYNTKVHCRQTLIGGNYGLLNKETFAPNPDYYSALLWHRLMGKRVLAVKTNALSYLRSYAHCSKEGVGVTLLLINLHKATDYIIRVSKTMKMHLHLEAQGSRYLNKTVSWIGSKDFEPDGPKLFREEYHLTPEDGYLRSHTMFLNGKPLELTENGDIPILKPAQVDVNSEISIAHLSIAFIVFPNFHASACA